MRALERDIVHGRPMNTIQLDHIRRFYHTHQQALFTYALSITRSREGAEDLVHSVFAAILQRDSLPEELRPYLFRSIRNGAIDLIRRQQHELNHAASIFESDTPRSLVETRLLIEEPLEILTEQERQAVVLKTYSGLTLQEIADVHEVSINTAASWYRRGLEKMRTRIEEVPHE